LTEIERLEKLLESDKQIIVLREKIKETSKYKMENGVMSVSDYIKEVNATDLSKQNEIDPKNIVEEYDLGAKEGMFNNKRVEVPQVTPKNEAVLGESTEILPTTKRIEVDLTKQRTYAYDGEKLVYSFLIIGLVLLYRFVNRDSLMVVINRSLPEREAGVLAGMLVGEKGAMSKDFYEWLKISGLVHLVIVSGSNVMLLSKGLIEGLAGYLGRKKTIIIVLVIAWSYAGMVRWEIPVVRAVLLVTIYYWAQLLGRKFNLFRAIILIILIMVLADYRVFGSGSFYLSFVAFGAVVINLNKERKWWSDFWNSFWVSLWLLPILALFFGKISVVAPLTNALILFLVEIITILGILGGFLGLLVPIFGKVVLWLSLPLLKYILLVVDWFASFKWASLEIKFNWWWMVGWYLILISKFLISKSKKDEA
jgi:competence protein ComEC